MADPLDARSALEVRPLLVVPFHGDSMLFVANPVRRDRRVMADLLHDKLRLAIAFILPMAEEEFSEDGI